MRGTNVTSLADTDGAILERYAYTAYGMPTILSPSYTIRNASDYNWEYRFGGYRFSLQTQLCYARNRELHCLLGTWLQRDPLNFADSVNLYEYGLSNPIVSIDPRGEVTLVEILIIGVLVIALIILLVIAGCELEKVLEQNRFQKSVQICVGKKWDDALKALSICGFANERRWAKDANGIKLFCSDEIQDRASTHFGQPGEAAIESTVFGTHCDNNGSDVAIQILGEYWRQHPDEFPVAAQTTKLNALITCLNGNPQIGPPNNAWGHREEDDELVIQRLDQTSID